MLQSLGRGIWMGNVLNVFIFMIAWESNEILGIVSAATGLSMTLIVFPAGYLSDKIKREWVLRGAAVYGIIGISAMFYATEISHIVFALIFWGFFQGISRPSFESIFADSVETGKRSRIYAIRHLVMQISMAAGPFINVFLFLLWGDEWDVDILKSVMIVGLIISVISMITLFFFTDDSLGELSEAIEEDNNNQEEVTYDQGAFINGREMYAKTNRINRYLVSKFSPTLLISIILISSNVIIGFGAGMTIKFFPVFFKVIYELRPTGVQLIMGFTSIFTGLFAIVAQRLSVRNGRAEMIFVFQSVAIACLLVIATYPPIWLLVIVFIARGAIMNASQPLSRSILMDTVPKKHRGKVNSMEAIAWGLFWNISAAIGGFLIGPDNNFRLCYLVTSGTYIIGTLLILLLIPLVKKEVEALEKE